MPVNLIVRMAGLRGLLVSFGRLRHNQRMRLRLLLLSLPWVLSACVPLDTYYKAGIAPVRLQEDTTNCQVRALRDAPVALQTRLAPPVFIPARRICDGANNCTVRPGYWQRGNTYEVDVNKDLRGRVETQCMQSKGYQRAQISACKSGEATVPATGAARLPKLTERSCYTRNPDGTLRVLNQG